MGAQSQFVCDSMYFSSYLCLSHGIRMQIVKPKFKTTKKAHTDMMYTHHTHAQVKRYSTVFFVCRISAIRHKWRQTYIHTYYIGIGMASKNVVGKVISWCVYIWIGTWPRLIITFWKTRHTRFWIESEARESCCCWKFFSQSSSYRVQYNCYNFNSIFLLLQVNLKILTRFLNIFFTWGGLL